MNVSSDISVCDNINFKIIHKNLWIWIAQNKLGKYAVN